MGAPGDVSGTWQVQQSNGYQPIFSLRQDGAVVSGDATLSAADQARGNYSGPTGRITGTLTDNTLDVRVHWAPKNDGQRAIGHYLGTVDGDRMLDGIDRDDLNPAYNGTWNATRLR